MPQVIPAGKEDPQRRYGIEVDRYEDVGRIVLEEGVLPVRIVTREELDSVPKEVWAQQSFTYPIGFPEFCYDWARGFYTDYDAKIVVSEEDYRKTCERMRQILALGFWVRYRTDDGTIYERRADGTLYRVDITDDGENLNTEYVFLRMATLEDDALYNLRDENDADKQVCGTTTAVAV